jgi:fatty-acyl-CoA synthase
MHMKEILIGYGQTEAAPLTTLTRPEDPVELRVGTVGRVLPHQELKIIDPVTGRTVPYGTQGEICFRGYMVMGGYDNMPKETAETIDENGWLHSGDLGTMDENGYVHITGRIKEMVIRGGENLFPREIEEFLHTLDIISDAHVVGVPDKRYGEELLACVKLMSKPGEAVPTEEEFKAMCKGKIAHFKIPRYWLVVDEFPMTVTGKVQKFKIRELGIRRFNLTEEGEAIHTEAK